MLAEQVLFLFHLSRITQIFTSKLPIIFDTKLSSAEFICKEDPEFDIKEDEELIEVLLERSEMLE